MRNMSKIAIINLKGGVGKSVTACNLACILAEKHSRRVLVMDLDKQANTTKFFQCFDPRGKTMASVLTLDNSRTTPCSTTSSWATAVRRLRCSAC